MKPGDTAKPVASICCFADGRDRITFDRNVGGDSGTTGAVVQRATADDRIVSLGTGDRHAEADRLGEQRHV